MELKIDKNDKEFFDSIESNHVKRATLVAIIQELRSKKVGEMGNKECRAVLATLQAYAVIFDFKEVFFPNNDSDIEDEPEEY